MNFSTLVFKVIRRFRLFYFREQYNEYRRKYDIHPSFKFNGTDIEFYGDGKIVIGENSYVGNRTAIACVEGCIVSIGNNCAISHNVRIYTVNRNPDRIIYKNIDLPKSKKGNVNIGDNVWVGANVFINQGVSIGDNCVVGANSVVTKSIPSNSIVVGIPAKVIRNNNSINQDK